MLFPLIRKYVNLIDDEMEDEDEAEDTFMLQDVIASSIAGEPSRCVCFKIKIL